MGWPFILCCFIVLTIAVVLAWCGRRRASLIGFCIFMILAVLTFWHHMDDALLIQL